MSLCRKAIPIMLKQKSGNIINVSSVGGLHGSRAGAAYTASKHGLVGLTKNIGYMYANDGIRCNVVCPGGVDTEITNNLHADDFGVDELWLVPIIVHEVDHQKRLQIFYCF